MVKLTLFSFVLLAVIAASYGFRKRDDAASSRFRLVPARANCKSGTLYFDGCNWCECLGTDKDECDKGECIEESDEADFVPESSERKRNVRRKRDDEQDDWRPKRDEEHEQNWRQKRDDSRRKRRVL